ncbi:UDP-N-acetylglucosamine 2-epimerase [Marinobacter sp. AN1]|uniref:UDP-N-acetylglucosamine 2-epimerase n=1 Tax=Marinobacter sp. AN1 TaxID=2886046 RepID=UPI00222EDFE0|nr:UDP-N-acetylglucosamine 2-epimerase [Marinobacter sp. AN1]UZD64738.1 UDP-N-acetylglucosamine 2-epimerase [Marinobacter sp. AN1]
MSSKKLKIIAFTSIRSEYDLMSGLYKELFHERNHDLRLVVSGAHLVESYGNTVQQIESDGLNIGYRVENLLAADSEVARIKSAAILHSACVDILSNEKPDLVIFAGDREDVLIYAMVSAFLSIPSIHFFAGDHAQDGHVDNPVRHAASKLASLHFVSTEQHRKRLWSIGEQDERIKVIGSVALDKFVHEPQIPKRQLLDLLECKHLPEHAKLAVLIFHPVAAERDKAPGYLESIANVLTRNGYHVLASMPNSDPGNYAIRRALTTLGESPHFSTYQNLSRSLFVNLLRAANLIIGNSSAGLLEAPSIPIATINVGERQKGRLAADSVVFCEGSEQAIAEALKEVESEPFQAKLSSLTNPYGDGKSVKKAADLIEQVNSKAFALKPEDPLENA